MEIAIVFLLMTIGLSLAGKTPDYCNVSTCGKTTLCGVVKQTPIYLSLHFFKSIFIFL
jgi:hypothetical protein